MKCGLPIGAFWVVIKPGSEDVFNVFRVTCYGIKALFSGEVWESYSTGLIRAGTACRPEVG